jgi:hypothetical protein
MGILTVIEGDGEKKHAATSHLQGELLNLFEHDIEPLAQTYAISSLVHTPAMAWKPLVLLMGDHSAGKSSLVNNILGFPLQPEGQEKSQHDFTVITGFRADDAAELGAAGAVLEEKRGDALIGDELYPFANLSRFGAPFAKHFVLKKVNLPRLANIALIDTPPLVRGEASYGADSGGEVRGEAIAALAALADMIVVFFDPHRPWDYPDTYNYLKSSMPEAVIEKKCVYVLNRIDTCTHLGDFLKVYGSLYWRLARTVSQEEMPKLFLTYSKAHTRTEASGKKSFINEISSDQHALERTIFDAAVVRLQHIAEYLQVQNRNLLLMVQIHQRFYQKNKNYVLKWAFAALLLSAASAGAGWYYAKNAMAATTEINEQLTIGIAAASGCLFFLLLLLIINKVGKKYARRNWLETLDDEVPLESSEQRATWMMVKGPLRRFLGDFAAHKIPMKKLKRDLRQLEKAAHTLGEELVPAIKDL